MWPFKRHPFGLRPARGNSLSMLGKLHGVERKRYFFGVFGELDGKYRQRILESLRRRHAEIDADPNAPRRLADYFFNNGRAR